MPHVLPSQIGLDAIGFYWMYRTADKEKPLNLQRFLDNIGQDNNDRWWRRGDLNPRPETRNLRYYMFRHVFNLMGVQPTARQPAHDSA